MTTPPRSAAVRFRPHFRKLSIAAGALWALGFIIWPGCATPPLLSSRTPAGQLTKTEVSAARKASLSRQEMTARFGKPDAWYSDLNVACYRLNHVTRRRLMLFLGVVPIGLPTDNLGLEVAMFQFDSSGQLKRQTRETLRNRYSIFGNAGNATTPAAERPGEFDFLMRSAAESWANATY